MVVSMKPAVIACVLGLLATATGCGADCRPGSDPPTLEIGSGEERFESIDGDEPRLEIIHGPQGGWHGAVALDATGLDGGALMGSHMLGWIDGVLHADTQPWVNMRCNPRTGTLQSWNNLLIWDVPPEELHGRTAQIEVEVTDSDGRTADDTVEVVLWDPLLDTGG